MDTTFEKREIDLFINGFDDAFAVYGFPKVTFLEYRLQIVQHHLDFIGRTVFLT